MYLNYLQIMLIPGVLLLIGALWAAVGVWKEDRRHRKPSATEQPGAPE